MSWSLVDISGKPADVYVPSASTMPVGVVLFLHGYDGVTLKDNPAYTQQLDKNNLACVCPHGPQCWWTDVIYPPFDEQANPIEYLAEQIPAYVQRTWQLESHRIAVTGFEMGGQGALQLAYRHARRFSTVVAISPKIDFETWWGHGTTLDELFADREAARQRTATLQLHPLNYPKHQLLLCDPTDPYCLDGVITLTSKLSSTGILFDQDFESRHGGFGWNYVNAMAPKVIAYIVSNNPPA